MVSSNITQRARAKLKGVGSKLGLSRKCPSGYILRAPYRRKFTSTIKKSGYNVHRGNKTYRVYPKASSVLVKASCVKDKGLPGKGPKSGTGIGPLKKGELTRYGYSAHYNRDIRHQALKKAIVMYGALDVYHKLDAVAKLTLRTAPDAHKVFVADRDWIRKNFELKKKASS